MNKNEKVSSKEVGLEIGLVISRFLYKTEHLHYGYWPEELEIIAENLRKAQDFHSELILDAIPKNVETILPNPNRLVIINHSLHMGHWVTPTNHWAKENRYTITGFCIDKDKDLPETWTKRKDQKLEK